MTKKVVLVAEDNPDDLTMILRALRKLVPPIEIVIAEDGLEALDYLQREGKFADLDPQAMPVLILLDLGLPHLDGLSVLLRTRQNISTQLIPVVVFTSQVDQQLKSYELGANSYIEKTDDPEAFGQMVERIASYWVSLNHSPPDRPS